MLVFIVGHRCAIERVGHCQFVVVIGRFGPSERTTDPPCRKLGDCLEMVQKRHPNVAATIVRALQDRSPGSHLEGVMSARDTLVDRGFDAPQCAGEVARPIPGPSAFPKWSHGERAVHELSNGEAFHFRCPDVPHPSPPSPLAPPSLIQPCLPVWPSTRFLWPPPCGMCCGGDPGEARFFCGVNSGTWVATNIRIQDMDIAMPNNIDERRVEILVDGLQVFHGAQLA